jgi:hypothetical protein
MSAPAAGPEAARSDGRERLEGICASVRATATC